MSSTTGRSRDKPVESPHHPIAIRTEHIAQETTWLYLQPKADPSSASDYATKDEITGRAIFFITGPRYGSGAGREFRDASGLPLFHLSHSFSIWKWRWRVRLPGGNFDLVFQNLATSDSKEETDNDPLTLAARLTTPTFFFTYEVLAAGRKIVDLRENVEKKKTIGHQPTYSGLGQLSLPPRRVLEICVAEGVDLSIVS
ncbi:hypothetical protein N7492_007028 [Penicillium capsulatum]|uniref:Uncharacterized protein n=1 Tax=Penicillium capsulatum TaxID=69766 RepID=A0A9W9I181_9EURO|nr:hypothetical protein N7492_007028 [Penicillium capsulatum]KAJ6116862.1 hypothetical protein N7512_006587 [Penicillium capsulatum]